MERPRRPERPKPGNDTRGPRPDGGRGGSRPGKRGPRPEGSRGGRPDRRGPRGDAGSGDFRPDRRRERPREGPSARAEAARRLVRIEQDDAFVTLARGAEAQDAAVDRQVTEYVAGVTRWRRRLDMALERAYRGDFAAMEPMLRQVLRIGAFELLITRTAPHAAINEAVDAAAEAVRPDATGVTNAVLRAVLRDKDLEPEVQDADLAERLAVRWSHPTWMVRRWLDRFGEQDTVKLLERNNRAPLHGLRIDGTAAARAAFTDMLREARIDSEPSAYLKDFVRVIRLQPVIRAKWIDRGYCTVQDESTGLVVHLLDPQPGDHVVDACAAPGGKSLYAASRMAGKGRITSVDVSAARLKLLEASRERARTPIETVAADFAEWATTAEPADRVLLDAPCSGLGVLARRADLRWRRSPEGIHELAALQDRLLDAAAAVVKPGGVLVYATCTIEPEENEERVRAFLSRHAGFSVEPADRWIPKALVTSDGFFASLPHRDDIDGAFGARLRRAR